MSCATLRRPNARGRTPDGRRRRKVSELMCELVEASQAPTRIDAEKLATQLVVRDFRDQKLVLANRATEPQTYVMVLARMTDLPEDSRIEQQLHGRRLSSPAG